MDMGNIMVIVCIWNSGVTIGDSRLRGGEFYRMITDRARELVKSIKDDVMMTGGNPANKSATALRGRNVGNTITFTTRNALDNMGHGEKNVDKCDEQIFSLFKATLTQEDLQAAKTEVDEAL